MCKEVPEYAEYGVGAMRSCLFRLQRAFENFWRRCKEKLTKKGFPRFKSKHRGIKSFDVPVCVFTIRERTNRWAIHIKGFVPFVVNNIPNGKIKCIRIVNSARRVKVQFVVEECDEVEKCKKPFQGIDLGVESLSVFDTGTKIAGRKRKLEKVKSRQREMNHKTRKRDENREDRKRKTFRSKTYLKTQKVLQKENQLVKEKEMGFVHDGDC